MNNRDGNTPDYGTEAGVEAQIQTKNLTAPRVTHADVDNEIVSAQYHVFPGTTVTVACLTLRNGFTVVGESACADPANFNEDVGRGIARHNARDKIWPLLGFALRTRLSLNKAWTAGKHSYADGPADTNEA